METLKLPDSELSEMKQFYAEEYERTERKLQHIKNMLARMGVTEKDLSEGIPQLLADRPGKATAGQASTAGKKAAGTAARRKPKKARKSKWELLILKRLRQLDRPVTYDELTDEIMTFSKLPEIKRKSTKQAVVNVIFRLRNRDQKLDTFSIGTREKYIALKGWFENPGEIKKEYAAKIEKPETPGKKRAARSGTRNKKT
ncbi:MAG TPA: hypothetical protein ENO05_01965 [Bacteroides sp.]|nr:hypothetical protein [Bacteroides sp.]